MAGQVVEITDETELQSIRDAAAQPAGSPTRLDIEKAAQLFADRDNPLYANSIKESISAVEAAGRDLSGKQSAMLGDALDLFQSCPPRWLHPALLRAGSVFTDSPATAAASATPTIKAAFQRLRNWRNTSS